MVSKRKVRCEVCFFFQAEDGIRDRLVTGVQTCALPILLLVSNERIVSRPITVNPRARAAQYEMRLSINIALGSAEEYLIFPETLMVERIYFEDIANIAGTQEEVEIITAEMRRELVNQLMRRLEAVET